MDDGNPNTTVINPNLAPSSQSATELVSLSPSSSPTHPTGEAIATGKSTTGASKSTMDAGKSTTDATSKSRKDASHERKKGTWHHHTYVH